MESPALNLEPINLNEVELSNLVPLYLQRERVTKEILKLQQLIISRAGDSRNSYAFDPRKKQLVVRQEGKLEVVKNGD